MTAETRAYLKAQIDAVRRQRLTRSYVSECVWCGADLPADFREEKRRFCTDRHRRQWGARYGQFLPPPALRPGPGKPKYLTEAERIEARRATWRKNRRNQYELYRVLTERFGEPRHQKWGSHLAELRRRAAA